MNSTEALFIAGSLAGAAGSFYFKDPKRQKLSLLFGVASVAGAVFARTASDQQGSGGSPLPVGPANGISVGGLVRVPASVALGAAGPVAGVLLQGLPVDAQAIVQVASASSDAVTGPIVGYLSGGQSHALGAASPPVTFPASAVVYAEDASGKQTFPFPILNAPSTMGQAAVFNAFSSGSLLSSAQAASQAAWTRVQTARSQGMPASIVQALYNTYVAAARAAGQSPMALAANVQFQAPRPKTLGPQTYQPTAVAGAGGAVVYPPYFLDASTGRQAIPHSWAQIADGSRWLRPGSVVQVLGQRATVGSGNVAPGTVFVLVRYTGPSGRASSPGAMVYNDTVNGWISRAALVGV